MQDEINVAIREKKKERNQNSKAYGDNRRLSQSIREMIRARKIDEARRACEEQVGLAAALHCIELTSARGEAQAQIFRVHAPTASCSCARQMLSRTY